MATKNKQKYFTSKKTETSFSQKAKAPLPKQRLELFDKMERFFTRHNRICLYLCLALALLFSLLLFNMKITDGADDALYIEAGYNYAKSFFNYYYTSTAPLYCMFLAIPIAIFGVKLVLLKMFSILFFLLGIFLYYKAFRGRIENLVLFPALFLTALNSLFLFYAGQTYTETFTLFMSGLFFCVLFKLDDVTEIGANIKENWSKFLIIGLLAYLLLLARNVAIVIPLVMLIYFLFQKKWFTGLLSLCSFGLFFALYNGVIKPLCWGHLNLSSQYLGQGNVMMQKNPYNPGLGNEDFHGFVVRFIENAKLYSTQLFDMTGLKSGAVAPYNYTFIAILLAFALAALIFSIIRKNRYIWLVLLYVSAFLAASFISLATSWGQARLIMIYLPLIAIFVFYAFYAFLRIKNMRWLQWIYPVLMVLFLLINIKKDLGEMVTTVPTLTQNLAGNKYYGFTPDWVNYFKASEWAADSLSKEAVIACRKASMSFIYTNGRSFYGINSVPSTMPDSALQNAKFEHHFVAINPQGMFMRTFDSIAPYMTALAMKDRQVYYVFDIPDKPFDFFVAEMKLANNKTFFDTPQVLLDTLKRSNQSLVIYPDLLLDNLRNKNVTYIIDASLRANAQQKTENTISTITRYINYIRSKYPNTFEKVHQTGKDNGEPAWVYKINYPNTNH